MHYFVEIRVESLLKRKIAPILQYLAEYVGKLYGERLEIF